MDLRFLYYRDLFVAWQLLEFMLPSDISFNHKGLVRKSRHLPARLDEKRQEIKYNEKEEASKRTDEEYPEMAMSGLGVRWWLDQGIKQFHGISRAKQSSLWSEAIDISATDPASVSGEYSQSLLSIQRRLQDKWHQYWAWTDLEDWWSNWGMRTPDNFSHNHITHKFDGHYTTDHPSQGHVTQELQLPSPLSIFYFTRFDLHFHAVFSLLLQDQGWYINSSK